jgi:Group II intron, maturase-specific domain
MYGCDLTFVFPQFKRRDLRPDRLRQFPVVRRFDTLWAEGFLGFIFICGRSRRGAFKLQRKTRGDRMRARLRQIKEALRKRMHEPIPVQGQWLRQVVRGYFAYHAVATNSRALVAFRHHVTDLWRRTLRRRSQKDVMTWGANETNCQCLASTPSNPSFVA